jgi:hypothetical protein
MNPCGLRAASLTLASATGRAPLCSVCLAFQGTANAGQSAPNARGRAHSFSLNFFCRLGLGKNPIQMGADNSGERFAVMRARADACLLRRAGGLRPSDSAIALTRAEDQKFMLASASHDRRVVQGG